MYSTIPRWICFADFTLTFRYSNTFTDEQVKKLHDAMMYVCDTAVGTLAESDKFPEDWLMKYRWSKGKKENPKLPNGSKITFLKVGGRTSAIVPSVQKKTAAVAGDVSDEAADQSEEEVKPKKAGKRKTKTKHEDEDKDGAVKEEEDAEMPAAKKQKKKAGNGKARKEKELETPVKSEDVSGRRRSGRLSRN